MNWTPEQRRAVTSLAPRICVDAGAGSGKTRVLIDRMVYLIEEGHAQLDDIVAITFTDKAAGEMKARLRQAFRAKATPDDAETMSQWRERERRVESARISTIHGFCVNLLRENALRQGMDPDFAVLADADGALLLHQVVTETFLALLDAEDEQAMLLGETFGAARVMATLKTMARKRSVVERADEAHWSGDAETLLAHWRDAVAEESRRRLAAFRHDPEVAKLITKLRSFENACEKPEDSREVLRRVQLDVLTAIVDGKPPGEINALARIAMGTSARGTKRKNWIGVNTADAVKAVQERVKDWLERNLLEKKYDPGETWQAARLTTALCGVYRRVAAAWDKTRNEANTVDFDDLIDRTRRLLEQDDVLCRHVAGGIRFLLMDEFQDTDANQLAIARALSEAPGGPALFIVGDAKQSIYYFRGAEVEVFAGERKTADEVIPLDVNFRTLPNVLDFINDFFEKTGALHRVEHPFKRLAAHREAAPEGRVEFLVPEQQDDEPKPSAEGGRRREAELIARRIAELCRDDAPPLVWDATAEAFRPAGYGDVAILLRGMSNVHLYENELRRLGIPHALVAGAGFYACREVMDVISLTRAVLDPLDEPAVTAFLRGPLAGLSDEDLLRLAQAGGVAKAFAGTVIPGSFADEATLTRARALVADLRAHLEWPPSAFLRRMLEATQFEAVLLGQYLGVQKVSNIRKLIEQAEAFAASRTPSVRAFVRYLEEVRRHDLREGEALLQAEGAVTIMTIHRSKGLEFPVVITADMSNDRQGSKADDLFAHRALGLAMKCVNDRGDVVKPPLADVIDRRVTDEEQAEHVRLLYVALTRARDYLIMSGSTRIGKKSWLAMMNEAFGVCARGDGGMIVGQGWQASVRRKIEDVDGDDRSTPAKIIVPEVLPERLGPPTLASTPRKTWSVSAILDHLADGLDTEEERPRDGKASPETRVVAMTRGTLVHRLFERWHFARDPEPLLAELVTEAGLPLGKQEAAMEDLRNIARRFCQTELGIRMASEGGILREAPFILRIDDALVAGTIDALLADGTIIDYKTGAHHEDCHERYEWQLLLYAAAVKALFGRVPERGYLCYVDSGVTYPVRLEEAQVAEAVRHARDVIAAMGQASR